VLLGVDRETHRDVIYEVRRVLRAGDPPGAGTAVGTVVVASLDDLVQWEPVDGGAP
jgi:hypothetical protein